MPEIMPGAEPFHSDGNAVGVLVVHGFTGSPCSMRPVATALADEGYTVTLPRLPGHGTTVQDMITTGWADWIGEVELAYQALAMACEKVFVIGLSMGGTLTLELATKHAEIAGIVVINAPSTTDPDMVDQVRAFVSGGAETTESIGNDIAMPDVNEVSYDETPLAPLLSMFEAVEALQGQLSNIAMPTLLITSKQDHVVDPANSQNTADSITAVAERLILEDSYHVATLDYDQALINKSVSEFVGRVASS